MEINKNRLEIISQALELAMMVRATSPERDDIFKEYIETWKSLNSNTDYFDMRELKKDIDMRIHIIKEAMAL